MRKSLVSISIYLCYCVCVKWRDIKWRCTTNTQKFAPVCSTYMFSLYSLCAWIHITGPSWDVTTTELFYVILIVCAFHLHRTIQSNYRVILCSPQTESHEWNPVAEWGALLSGLKESIMGLQWWCSGLLALAMLGSIHLSTTPSYNTLFIHLATSSFQLDTVWCNHILCYLWYFAITFHMALFCK